MKTKNNIIFVAILANLCISYCEAASIQKQLEHIARRKRESLGIPVEHYRRRRQNRRLLGDDGIILGMPSRPAHLPEAEAVLPGHTLIKPALGMLKSAVKYPHKDLDEGSGVYGNYDSLGARYPGTQDRVLYGSFRRMPSDYLLVGLPQPESNFAPKSNYLASALGLEPVGKDDPISDVLKQLHNEKFHKQQKASSLNFEDILGSNVVENLSPNFELSKQGSEDDAILTVLNKINAGKTKNNIKSKQGSEEDTILTVLNKINAGKTKNNIKSKQGSEEDTILTVLNKINAGKTKNNIKSKQGSEDDTILTVLNKINEGKTKNNIKFSYAKLEDLLSRYVKEKRNAEYNLKKLLQTQHNVPNEKNLEPKFPSRRVILSSDEIEPSKRLKLNYSNRKNEVSSENDTEDDKHSQTVLEKDHFDHIKIKDSAPDYKTLLPGVGQTKNVQSWWYFNEFQDSYMSHGVGEIDWYDEAPQRRAEGFAYWFFNIMTIEEILDDFHPFEFPLYEVAGSGE